MEQISVGPPEAFYTCEKSRLAQKLDIMRFSCV